MAAVGDGWHQKGLDFVTAGIGGVGRGREFCGVAILGGKLYSDHVALLSPKLVAKHATRKVKAVSQGRGCSQYLCMKEYLKASC